MTGGHHSAHGLTVWLTGEGAATACGEAAALLRDLGRPTVLAADPPTREAAPALAAAGIVVLSAGEGAEAARELHERAGARFAQLELNGADRVPEAPARTPARRVLDLVDHGLEVASRPIFVIGAGRSGTTWTLELLASHPRVEGLYETLILAPERFAHLRPGGLDAATRSDRTGYPYGLGQLVDRPEALRDARVTATSWLAGAVGGEHDWLVEKTPSHAEVVGEIAEVLPEARFIHVLRDARDVLASRKAGQRTALREPRPYGALIREPLAWRSGREWAATTARVAAARPRLSLLEVRYERLHAEPVATCLEMFEFCGIPCDEALASEIADRNDFSRLPDTGDGKFRRRGRVGDWRSSLSLADRALVCGAAGGALARQDYLRRAPAIHTLARVARALARVTRGLARRARGAR